MAVSAQQADSPFAGPHRLLEQGKFSEAIAALEELRKSKPELEGLSRELGIAYYRKGDYLNAVANLQRAIKEDANDGEATATDGTFSVFGGQTGRGDSVSGEGSVVVPERECGCRGIFWAFRIFRRRIIRRPALRLRRCSEYRRSRRRAICFTARMLLRLDFGPVAEEYGKKAIALDSKLPLAHFFAWRALPLPVENSRSDRATSAGSCDQSRIRGFVLQTGGCVFARAEV